jgi:hypothetical protein
MGWTPPRPLGHDVGEGLLQSAEAAHADPEDAADFHRIDIAFMYASLFPGLAGRNDGVLGKHVHLLGFPGIEIVLYIKAFDLRGNLRRVISSIEAGDRPDAAFSAADGLPEICDIVTQGIHSPHAGDNHSPFHSPPPRKTAVPEGVPEPIVLTFPVRRLFSELPR